MSDAELCEAPREIFVLADTPAPARTPPHSLPAKSARIDGVRIGVLAGLAEDGRTPMLIFPNHSASVAMPGRSTLKLRASQIGQDVVLMFEDGDPILPIVMGFLSPKSKRRPSHARPHIEVDADGESFVVSSREQLVLRCGKASITLTKAGKVLIQGAYLSSRSTGVIRIKGGSVQLN
jgi:Domain of unknown function (DUF6484)